MLARVGRVVAWGGMAVSLVLAGCAGSTGLFNPEFLASLGGGTEVASVPGEAPALQVAVENRTDNVIAALLSYRTKESGVESVTVFVDPLQRTAEAVLCPVEELTLGDVSDPNAVGAIVRLGEGGPDDPYIEVEAFGLVLQEGVNYECGDGITFAVERSRATRSGYRIFAYIRPGR